jgi:hypothetical protein
MIVQTAFLLDGVPSITHPDHQRIKVFCQSAYQRSKSGMIALFFWRMNVTDRMV